MRIWTWLKVLMIGLLLFVTGIYTVFTSDWFQKKYMYPFLYQEAVYTYALEYDLNPFLIAGVIRTESKFFAEARSPKGAIGLMQIMPETGRWIAEQREQKNFMIADLNDPDLNIRFGTWYLASLKKEFAGNEVLYLAAYNGGRGNVKQWMQRYEWSKDFDDIEQIPFKETREYVERVLNSKKRYQELYGR
ncbi:lytic transglycosylase domain-containing protein [Sporomusa malonica]|uniref:Soluble lytic murein transglycosylase n=1 Tax=Sporomusa malonica TaxID=112901 RepID=A0A1W2BNS1_9FIRM|nr:lytic transglycosylase domain-containing protein [Sporomusa malonica]SMC74567.1 soluble lytic murein transglycosylase [Sporomusa malonica]